jgi:hypothetical protein
MVTATSLSAMPDPESVTDKASASDALCSMLAVVATVSADSGGAREDQPAGLHEDSATVHVRLEELFHKLHGLLPAIAYYRRDITGWSVTVGTSITLTMNFTNNTQGPPLNAPQGTQ